MFLICVSTTHLCNLRSNFNCNFLHPAPGGITAPHILGVPIFKIKKSELRYPFFFGNSFHSLFFGFLSSVRTNLFADVFVKVLQVSTAYVSWCLQVADPGVFVVCSRLQEKNMQKTHKICNQQDFQHRVMSFMHLSQYY